MSAEKVCIPLYNKETDEKKIITDFAEIQIHGKNVMSDNCEVYLKMSKEALIGFATYAVRIATTTEETYKFHWQVDPLGNPCGNQPLGFFLTSDSPSFVLMYNQAEKLVSNEEIICKEIEDKIKMNFEYEVPLEVKDNAYEPFEIGFENIAEIKIIDNNGIDVTNDCVSVVLKINKTGLFKFGVSMLRIAHNYFKDNEYRVYSINKIEDMYNMGIALVEKSSKLRIKCCDFGNVLSYEPNFGKIN